MKNVQLKLVFEGNGPVNFDSNEQGDTLRALAKMNPNNTFSHLIASGDNNVYGKKRIYEKNGKLTHVPIISAHCLKHAIRNEDVMPYHEHLPNSEYVKTIATINTLVYGFLHTTLGYNKKSCFLMTDAEMVGDVVTKIDFNARSGNKNVVIDVTDEDKKKMKLDKSTSIFNKETFGISKYESTAFFVPRELQFISADNITGRPAINFDNAEMFLENLRKITGIENVGSAGYFNRIDAGRPFPEQGILLSKEVIVFIFKQILKDIITNLEIFRGTGYAKVSELYYKINENALSNNDNYIQIKSIEDIENITFDPQILYVEATPVERSVVEQMVKNNDAYHIEKSTQKKLEKDAKNKERDDKKRKVEEENSETNN